MKPTDFNRHQTECKSKAGHYFVDRHGLRANMGQRIPLADRAKTFWSLVNKNDPSGCWIWLGTVDGKGYGHFHVNGKGMLVHRFAWLLTFGSFPEKPFLCHSCDNPRCCNPSHLFPGTNADNIKDAALKNRTANGCKHSRSKLTEDQILEILTSASVTKKISRKMGVSCATIYRVRHGTRYKHEVERLKSIINVCT